MVAQSNGKMAEAGEGWRKIYAGREGKGAAAGQAVQERER